LGFSAALMKKRSVTTKGLGSDDSRSDVLVVESNKELKLGATEAVILSALESFFDVVLNYPKINRYTYICSKPLGFKFLSLSHFQLTF
jgi:hypothetical protein